MNGLLPQYKRIRNNHRCTPPPKQKAEYTNRHYLCLSAFICDFSKMFSLYLYFFVCAFFLESSERRFPRIRLSAAPWREIKITWFIYLKIAVTYPPSLLRTNAAKKPTTVINPAKLCAFSNASGIIVSTIIAKMAPAAIAVVAAMISADK
ncbi:hypothetical protein NIES4075_37760 [Tolypothrix sp. NIES-4075]|nr:hypothetical protein NIES4075_37760 [Tolypothrix sp. NIES-4075]